MPDVYLAPDDYNKARSDLWAEQARQQLADAWEQNVRLRLPDIIGETQRKLQQIGQPLPPPTPDLTATSPAPQASSPAALSPVAASPPPGSSSPAGAPAPASDLRAYARMAAQKVGIDPNIFERQIQQESGFNPNAQSPAGAQGIAQIVPQFHPGVDVTNPQASLDYAANLMSGFVKQYGGDIGKALAAYNAGPGAVAQYGGVPPFEETKRYVSSILGGGGAQAGTSAPSAPQSTAGVPAARTSQFQLGLSDADAYAACGPAAAIAFANQYGRNPTAQEALDLARKYGWTREQGMAGIASEQKLLSEGLGIPTRLEQQVDWSHVASDAQNGNPVIVSTPGHYFYVSTDPQTGKSIDDQGRLYVGTSGTDLKGGSPWMSPQEIQQREGAAQGALYADNPQTPGQSIASTGSGNPLDLGSLVGRAAEQAVRTVPGAGAVLDNFRGATDALRNITPTSELARGSLGMEQIVSENRGLFDEQQRLVDAYQAARSAGDTQRMQDIAAQLDTLQAQIPDPRNRDVLHAAAERNPSLPFVETAANLAGGAIAAPLAAEGMPLATQALASAIDPMTGLPATLGRAAEQAAPLLRSRQRGEGVNPLVAVRSGGVRAAQATQSVQDAVDAIKPTLTPTQVDDAARTLQQWTTSTGKLVGMPPAVNSAEDLAALRVHLNNLVDAGEPGKDWYIDSARQILQATHGNRAEAEKLTQLVALMARNVNPDQNINYAIEAWNLAKAGLPVQNVHRFSDVSREAADLLEHGTPWEGRKTNSFYVNLMEEIDPSFLAQQKVTADIWINRAFGYVGKAPAGQQYNFIEDEVRRIAQERDLRPSQVQAMMWVGQQGSQVSRAETAAENFATGLLGHRGQVSWETSPGTGVNVPGYAQASPEARQLYHQDVGRAFLDDQGQDIITREFGVLGGRSFDAPGVSQGTVSPGGQTYVNVAQTAKATPGGQVLKPASRAAIDSVAAARGYFLKQDAVGWAQVFQPANPRVANTAAVDIGGVMTPRQAGELDAALTQAMGGQPYFITATERGAWVTNLSNMPNPQFQKVVDQALEGVQSIDNAQTTALHGVSGLVENDWLRQPNGEGYTDTIRASGFDRAFRRIQDSLAGRVSQAQAEAAARYFGAAGQPAGTTQAGLGQQLAAASPRFATSLAGGVGGGYAGYQSTPENAPPEERFARTVGGAALGAAAGYGASRLLENPEILRSRQRAEGINPLNPPSRDPLYQGNQFRAGEADNPFVYRPENAPPIPDLATLGQRVSPADLASRPAIPGTELPNRFLQRAAFIDKNGTIYDVGDHLTAAETAGMNTAQDLVNAGAVRVRMAGSEIAVSSAADLTPGQRQAIAQIQRAAQDRTLRWDVGTRSGTGLGDLLRTSDAAAAAEPHGLTINLPKYTPDEVRTVIQQAYDAHPEIMDAARRGVIPDDVVREMANQVGRTPAQIAAIWKPGQAKNAETILALRQGLADQSQNVLAAQQRLKDNPNDRQALEDTVKALIMHASVQETVTGVTAEAGRALRQFRQPVEGMQATVNFLQQLAKRYKVSPDELGQAIAKADLSDPVSVALTARSLTKFTATDKLTALWYFNLLANPLSHVRNVVSNAVTAAVAPLETIPAATIDVARSAVMRAPRERYYGELPARYVGMVMGMREGLENGLQILAHGFTNEEAAGALAGTAASREALGPIIGSTGRALGAEDAFFRAVNKTAALYGNAYRQASQEGLRGQALADRIAELRLDPALLEGAKEEGAFRVFQSPSQLANGVADLARKYPLLNIAVPFRKTPINIAKYVTQYSPAGIGTLIWDAAHGQAGTAGQVEDRMARIMIGSTVLYGLMQYAQGGNLTGAPPDSPAERDAFLREHPAYSFKAGDHWYSYTALQPFSSLFAAAAAVQQAQDKGMTKEADTAASMVAWSVAKSMTDMPWLLGLTNALEAIHNPQQMGGAYAESLARSAAFPTSLWSFVNRATDNMVRNPENPGQAFVSQFPGLTGAAPSRLTAFGNEVQRPQEQMGLGALNPFNPAPVKDDPVDQALKDLQMHGFTVEPGFVGTTVTVPKLGQAVTLTSDEQRQMQKSSGQLAYALLLPIVSDPRWSRMPPASRAKVVETIISKSRDAARTQLMPALIPRGIQALNEQNATGIRKPAPKP